MPVPARHTPCPDSATMPPRSSMRCSGRLRGAQCQQLPRARAVGDRRGRQMLLPLPAGSSSRRANSWSACCGPDVGVAHFMCPVPVWRVAAALRLRRREFGMAAARLIAQAICASSRARALPVAVDAAAAGQFGQLFQVSPANRRMSTIAAAGCRSGPDAAGRHRYRHFRFRRRQTSAQDRVTHQAAAASATSGRGYGHHDLAHGAGRAGEVFAVGEVQLPGIDQLQVHRAPATWR